jgi:cation transport regulator
MPYENIEELPAGVRNNLPRHAQEIYLAAYNNASERYVDPGKRRDNSSLEQISRKIAWAAVKKEFQKDTKTGAWTRKPGFTGHA